MATYHIHIDIDNAAFGDTDFDARNELADILEAHAERLRVHGPENTRVNLKDHNGNTVGYTLLRGNK